MDNTELVKQATIQYKNEEELLQKIGQHIGYGNMMSIASSLWRMELIAAGYPSTGAFIPVNSTDISSEAKEFYDQIIRDKDERVRKAIEL